MVNDEGDCPMKIGIIGAGGMGRSHANQLKQMPDVEITGICDINEERAHALASQVNATVYTDYRDLLSTDIDAVWVCTPDFAHRQPVIAAAEAGKHIFCEKPIAVKMEDADAMVEAVERAGVITMIGYVLRFFPIFATVRNKFASGELGTLVTAWIRRFMPWSPRDWYGDPELSGGIAVDFSTHDIDWLMWVGGDVKAVYARTAAIGTRTDNDMWAILTFANGGTGVVGDSFVASIGGNCFGVIGSEGTAMVEAGSEVQVKKRTQEAVERIAPEGPHPTYAEDAYFIECVRTGAPANPDMAWARNVLRVSLAIRESASTGRVVQLL